MGNKKVRAADIARDIKEGVCRDTLMERYGLSSRQLDLAFSKLLAAGLITVGDLARERHTGADSTSGSAVPMGSAAPITSADADCDRDPVESEALDHVDYWAELKEYTAFVVGVVFPAAGVDLKSRLAAEREEKARRRRYEHELRQWERLRSHCLQCGRARSGDELVCSGCGTGLSQEETPPPREPAPEIPRESWVKSLFASLPWSTRPILSAFLAYLIFCLLLSAAILGAWAWFLGFLYWLHTKDIAWYDNLALLLISFITCFPGGFYALYRNTRLAVWKKWAIGLGWCAIMGASIAAESGK
jgi:hypothetical protein